MVGTKHAVTPVRNGSNDVADSVNVSDLSHEDENSRLPTSQKLNFPQLNQSSSSKLKGSGSPLIRKPAPPVPAKPAHLQRNCLTPPPKPGNLSTVLGLSSYSLPEYEMSDLEHPQLSSTLKSQVLPRTPFTSKALSEESKPQAEPKPHQVPARRDSMMQINDVTKRSLKTVVSTITSLEESFITRFRPVSDFPAPDVFTSCEKTYPSIEQGCVGRRESDQLVDRTSFGREEDIDPARDHPPPPLPSTAPPARSVTQSNFNEHIPVTFARPPAQPTVPPPPPPLPVEKDIPAVKPRESSIPPPPPLPSSVPCPVPINSDARPVVQASTPVIQSKEELSTCKSPGVDDSVTSIVKSGFADNLAKLYGSTKRTENCCSDEPPPLAAKPRPPPVINKKPALLKDCGMKLPGPQRPSSLRLRQPHPAMAGLPSNTTSSSASSTSANSSPLSARETKTSSAPKPPRSAPPPPPPPAPLRTSSLSTSPSRSTPPAVYHDSSAPNLSRSLSLRSAPPPPPPVPVHSSGLDINHSLRTSSTSPSSPLPNPSESITRRYSFRAAPPPPPQSLNPTESPGGRESSSHSSSRLGGPVLHSPKLLIC
jgi:hypothetical protein